MQGRKPSDKTVEYIGILYKNRYPNKIIAERTSVSVQTVLKYIRENEWKQDDIFTNDPDGILLDFQNILARMARRLLTKATEDEYDEEYKELILHSRTITITIESLMKQAVYQPARQAETYTETALHLIEKAEQYTDEQKKLLREGLLAIKTQLVEDVVKTIERLSS